MNRKKAALLAVFAPLIVTPIVLRQVGVADHEAGFGLSWSFFGGFVGGFAFVVVLAVLFGKFKKKHYVP